MPSLRPCATLVTLGLAAITGLVACGEGKNVTAPPPPPPPPPPPTGSIRVTVAVGGNGSDADGFSISHTAGTATVAANGSTTIPNVPAGDYSLQLSDVAQQCFTSSTALLVPVLANQTVDAHFAVTCYGGLAWVQATSAGWRVFYLGEDGRVLQLTHGPGTDFLEDWSPDGTRVVFETNRNGNQDLYTVRVDGTDLRRLTTHPHQDLQPRWSPDGQSIVFHRTPNESGAFQQASVHTVKADGTGERSLLDTLARDFDPTWVTNGDTVLFSCDRFGGFWDLCAVASNGTGFHRVLFSNGAQHADAAPGGEYVGFQSFEGGQAIWVAPADGSSSVNLTPGLVSFDFGWSPDASELVIVTYDGDYVVQRVKRDGTGLTRLTLPADAAGDPRWSADGARIAFYSLRSGQQVWVMNPDGSGARQITTGPDPKFHPRWNPQARPGLAGSPVLLTGAPSQAAGAAPAVGRSASVTCVRAAGQVLQAPQCKR